ncbi:MAG: sigma-54 dependent transcriptional regulator [Bdellovibrionales bacterium]|nr:sigma-54 dependent transcriptional regulator [Bdellovibrionales bacterium]
MGNSLLPKVIAIDDDQLWLDQVPLILEGMAIVETASTINEGIAKIQDGFFDVVLLDLNFEGDERNGLDAFRMIQGMDRGLDVIVISGETNPQKLIEVFNFGVTRFISKPATVHDIRLAVRSVTIQREEREQVLQMSSKGRDSDINPLIGNSTAMRKLRDQVSLLLEVGAKDILLQGETGTGKDTLAKYIARAMEPNRAFIPLHCGAIAEGLVESELFGHVKGAFTGADRDKIGLFEAAAGGFVFLDEIGEMPLFNQVKLLRVLQERAIQRVGSYEERRVNFRLIAATHVDLQKAVQEKKFREDLYYRISKNVVRIPSLRERKEDIGMLLTSLKLTKKEKPVEFSQDAIDVLQSYDWPGNIRQLRDTAERIINLSSGTTIRQADVFRAAPEFAAGTRLLRGLVGAYGTSLIANEKKRFLLAIEQANGSRDEAAKILGISRATFFRRIKELGLARGYGKPGN